LYWPVWKLNFQTFEKWTRTKAEEKAEAKSDREERVQGKGAGKGHPHTVTTSLVQNPIAI